MNKFYVLGLGPGNKDYILPISSKIIKNSQVLIGGERNIKSVDIKGKEIVYIRGELSNIVDYIKENSNKKISIVVSGDTGFYSMLGFISRNFHKTKYEVVPGISSMQYMFSKIGEMWHDAYISSVHGRNIDYVKKSEDYKFVGLLTDKINTPVEIAKRFLGREDIRIYVGENLSYENENIEAGNPEEIIKKTYENLNVVIIENLALGGKK